MYKLKYYLFAMRWYCKNRNWSDTRQKFKAMEREWVKRCKNNGAIH